MQTSTSLNYQIVNVVSLWDIGPIEINVDNSKRKKRFNAEVIRKPEGTFLVFGSGRVTATGFKSVSKAGATLQEVFPTRCILHKGVANIVAHSYVPYPINTLSMIKFYDDTTWEPEIHPAVYIRIDGVTLMYYTTGSIIVVGAKEEKDIISALAHFEERALPLRV